MTPEEAGAADASANREAWLQQCAAEIATWFEKLDIGGTTVPPIRVSVGWPSRGGTSQKKRVVGQCWSSSSADDGIGQIFISPTRGGKHTVEALATLVHEMVHAIDDCESGHRGNFVRIARAIGLVPKWTQSTPGDELLERLEGLVERFGPMPSGAITGSGTDAPKKQSTRMLKLQCPDDGYVVRTSQKWIDVGLPSCPCGAELEEAS